MCAMRVANQLSYATAPILWENNLHRNEPDMHFCAHSAQSAQKDIFECIFIFFEHSSFYWSMCMRTCFRWHHFHFFSLRTMKLKLLMPCSITRLYEEVEKKMSEISTHWYTLIWNITLWQRPYVHSRITLNDIVCSMKWFPYEN